MYFFSPHIVKYTITLCSHGLSIKFNNLVFVCLVGKIGYREGYRISFIRCFEEQVR